MAKAFCYAVLLIGLENLLYMDMTNTVEPQSVHKLSFLRCALRSLYISSEEIKAKREITRFLKIAAAPRSVQLWTPSSHQELFQLRRCRQARGESSESTGNGARAVEWIRHAMLSDMSSCKSLYFLSPESFPCFSLITSNKEPSIWVTETLFPLLITKLCKRFLSHEPSMHILGISQLQRSFFDTGPLVENSFASK